MKRKAQGCFRAGIPRPWRWRGGSSEAVKRYRAANSEQIKIRRKAEYQRNKIKYRERSQRWKLKNRDKWLEQMRKASLKQRVTLRSEMISAYGSKCNCCGESIPQFLELDHIDNDGNCDRKENGCGVKLLGRLKKQGWPKKRYQLLCSNCNQGKQRNGGICPHKITK